MSRMRRFVRFVAVPLALGAAMLTSSNLAHAADSAWTRATTVVSADQSMAKALPTVSPLDSAWT
ncbi:hypothetical protein CFP65_3655 [Kitasatospora sp. MMS16-BH015]|uniref:hypothetical protein n=1 Tax=Kitasatospora sp. MMS16-BH015 TaxID=2018025 RepID=UPI000CA3A2CE|nr:hypothetical protein [Kitasatospora sp. MMS16-BH015]AUG78443.1 hypothetical protein CFP65_3655 [Kitasatospora sp. MMS16-BH015]